MIDSRTIRESLEGANADEQALLDMGSWAEGYGTFDDDDASLFTAPAFLEFRIRHQRSAAGLIENLRAMAESASEFASFRLIANAISLSSEVLERDLSQLPTQLLARLPRSNSEIVASLLGNLEAEYPGSLIPSRTGLIQSDQAYSVRRVTDGRLRAMVCSQEKSLVAVLDEDGKVVLVEVRPNRFEILGSIRCPRATALAFAPDGNCLIATAKTGTAWVIEVTSRSCTVMYPIDKNAEIRGCLDADRFVLDLEEGEGLAIGSLSEGAGLTRIGVEEGATAFETVTIDGTRMQVITGGLDGRIDAWDPRSGRFARRLGWFGGFKEGWDDLASASLLGAMLQGKVWAVGSQGAKALTVESSLPELEGFTEEQFSQLRRSTPPDPLASAVRAVALNARADILAAVGDGRVCTWDVDTGKRVGQHVGIREREVHLAIDSKHDRLFCSAERFLRIWRLPRLEPLGLLPMRGGNLVDLCCPRDAGVVVGAFQNGTLTASNPDLASIPLTRTVEDPLVHIGWCPQEQPLVYLVSCNGRIEEWALDGSGRIRELSGSESELHAVSMSDSGRRLAVRTESAVLVRDVATGMPLYRVPYVRDPLREQRTLIGVNDTGNRVLLGIFAESLGALLGSQGQLLLFEVATRDLVVLDDDPGRIERLVLSGCGRRAVICTAKIINSSSIKLRRSLSLWDLDARQKVRELELEPGAEIKGCHISEHGRTLLWHIDETLYALDLADAASRPQGMRIDSPWSDFVIDPSGQFLIARSGDSRLELFAYPQLAPIAAFDADHRMVSANISAQHGALIACDESGFVYSLRCEALRKSLPQHPDTVEPERWETSDTMVERIDYIGRLERAGYFCDSENLLIATATADDANSYLRMGVARALYDSGAIAGANAILRVVVADQDSQVQLDAVELLMRSGGPEGVRLAFGASATPALLHAAAELAARKDYDSLRDFATNGPTDVIRLIAGQALAGRDDRSALSALRALIEDATTSPSVIATAWVSLGRLLTPVPWLDALRQIRSPRDWSEAIRLRLSWEIVGSLTSNPMLSCFLAPLAGLSQLGRVGEGNPNKFKGRI